MHLHFRSPVSLLALLFCASAAAAQSGFVNLRPRTVSSGPDVPNVKVSVDRQRVPLGMQVTFTVSPPSVVTNPQYAVTLYFGDQRQKVMDTSTVVHLYKAVGTYTYSILVKQKDPARVTLAATPTSIEEGDTTNFEAQFSGTEPNPQFRFIFGDAESSAWQASPRVSHAYQRRGAYLARVEVGTKGAIIAKSAPTQVKVNQPTQPSVSVYLTVSSPQPSVGETVTFRARVSPARPNTEYRFSFGDGQQSIWQGDPQAQHVYKTPGYYPASVEVQQSDPNHKLNGKSAATVLAVQKSPGPTPTPTARPTPRVTPTPDSSASPTPTATQSPTPGGSPTANPTGDGTPPVIGGVSPSPGASPSGPDWPKWLPPLSTLWKYLLGAGLLLLLIYKASGLLFAAQPTFAAFSDPGVSDLADEKAGLPIDFQFVLDPNVSAADYKIDTQGTSLLQNPVGPPQREILEF